MERASGLLDEGFVRAVDLVVGCASAGGTVLVSGLGKSGLIGAKIAATLASLGIPSHAVHPTEAAHGDLGRFRAQDLAVCLSHSGETEEVVALAATLRQDGLPVIAITRGMGGGGSEGPSSSLARVATVTLWVPVEEEAGGREMVAPTSSTTVALAIGDALALSSARRMRFTADDFAKRHPGGTLGGLLRPVVELLRFRAGVNLPLAHEGWTIRAALLAAEGVGRRPGAVLAVDDAGRLTGILTDGDLRRFVLHSGGDLTRTLSSVMTPHPRALVAGALAREAVTMVREYRQDEIPVVDEAGRPVGLLDVQDLIAMRLVRGEAVSGGGG